MNTINLVSLKDKRVLIRVDFNVPLDNNLNITDDSRIIAALPSIKKVVSDGGVAIIISHLGRPNKGEEKKYTLRSTVKCLSEHLKMPVSFSANCIGENTVSDVKKIQPGGVILLENLRFHSEEMSGDMGFAKKLAELGDTYVNDAFGASHRNHASITKITDFFPKNKYFGLLLHKEISSIKKAIRNPKRPFTAIIGGAKISGKIDVIKSLFNTVDNLIIGGGMAYTFIKAIGGQVGKSIVENEKLILAQQIIEEAKTMSVNLILPSDSVNAKTFQSSAPICVSNIFSIDENYMGLDIGGQSISKFTDVIKESKTIIWNGPMGVFEMDRFMLGTKKIGEAVALATKSGAFSLVGGGDSISAVKKFNLKNKISYISTGGGAMLKYLEGSDLPGVNAILS